MRTNPFVAAEKHAIEADHSATPPGPRELRRGVRNRHHAGRDEMSAEEQARAWTAQRSRQRRNPDPGALHSYAAGAYDTLNGADATARATSQWVSDRDYRSGQAKARAHLKVLLKAHTLAVAQQNET